MNVPTQYRIRGRSASEIAQSVEDGVRTGRLAAGAVLPTVRALAETLGVAPGTVAAAYRTLRLRGLLEAEGRRGTTVRDRPPIPAARSELVPTHLRNVADGNPDPAQLPALGAALAGLRDEPRLYGRPAHLPALLDLARWKLTAEGLPDGALAVTGGAMDAVERVLQAHLRPGDRVAVEDPGYPGIHDLVSLLGLSPEPFGVDDAGPLPDELERALAHRVRAVVVTPRAQNPFGSALSPARARMLRPLLDAHPEVLLVEDDHAGPIAGAPATTLVRGSRERWAHVRSVSKWLGPDLRLAVLAGDPRTVARVEGRQGLGAGWVSHVLQELVLALWSDPSCDARLAGTAALYAERRKVFLDALAEHGLAAHGRSGMNVWIPVEEEASTVAALAAAGWAVRAGERYRLKSPPGIRVTISTLEAADAERLARDVAAALGRSGRTRLA
jgi:DNA-binding transcriptional MocR family regulator